MQWVLWGQGRLRRYRQDQKLLYIHMRLLLCYVLTSPQLYGFDASSRLLLAFRQHTHGMR